MKIALFSDTFPPQVNGVAHTVYRFALALTEAGHEVRVFTVSGHKAETLKKPAQEHLTVHYFPSLPALVYPGERAGIPFAGALAAVKAFAPDIIHTHTPFSVGLNAVRCARALKVPLVGTHHTFFDHYLQYVYLDYSWARTASWKLTVRYYNYCDLVTSPTRTLAHSLKTHGLTKPIGIIPNMLDTDFFTPGAPAPAKIPRTICYMGRLSYEKSVDDAIAAAALVMEQLPDTRLIIVGDGPERKTLEDQAERLGISANIAFTGYLRGTELVQKLQEADVFITGSKSENMPLALLEAMAVGLPIVAVRSLGLEEILRHEENALLVAPGKPEELAAAALRLLQDNPLHARFSKAAREMSLIYSKQAVLEQIIRVYERLTGYAATQGARAGQET